ncbi:MAG: hypothetical protein QW275_03645, partial [Candidatus Anstonellaceae archaeon]
MPKKLWGGRFENPQKEELFRFLSSENVQLDEKLLLYDIYGNMAHVCMLAKQKLVAKEEAGEILSALLEIKEKAESG